MTQSAEMKISYASALANSAISTIRNSLRSLIAEYSCIAAQTPILNMPAFTLIDFSREVLDEICSYLVPTPNSFGTQYYPPSCNNKKWRRPKPTRSHLYNLALTCKTLHVVVVPWLHKDLIYPTVDLGLFEKCLTGKEGSRDDALLRLTRGAHIGHVWTPATSKDLALVRDMRTLQHISCQTTYNDRPESIDALSDAFCSGPPLESLRCCRGVATTHSSLMPMLERLTAKIQITRLSLVDLDLTTSTRMSLGSLPKLDRMDSLRRLSIDGCLDATDFLSSIPATLARLTHLTLDRCNVKPDTFAGSSMPQLQFLHLRLKSDWWLALDLTPISAFPSLRHFGWGGHLPWSNTNELGLLDPGATSLNGFPNQIDSLAWLQPVAQQLRLFADKLSSPSFMPRLRHCSYSIEQAAQDIAQWLEMGDVLAYTDLDVANESYDALLAAIGNANSQLEKRGISVSPPDFAEQFKLAFEAEKLWYYRYQ